MDKLRGHDIEIIDGVWCYSDTTEPTEDSCRKRPCGYCNEHNNMYGHDACIGTLPNVMNACCGHGVNGEAYIQFYDGRIIRGNEAVYKQQLLKTN